MGMKPSRRQVLIGGGLLGGGLAVGAVALSSGPSRDQQAAKLVAKGDEQVLATWLKLTPDNKVTVILPHGDMGQGITPADVGFIL